MRKHLRRYLWLACLVTTSLCLDPPGFGLGFCLLPLPEMAGWWAMLRQNGGVASGSECDLSGLSLLTGGLRWIDTAGARPDRMRCWWQATGLLRVASGRLIDSAVWRGPPGDLDVHGRRTLGIDCGREQPRNTVREGHDKLEKIGALHGASESVRQGKGTKIVSDGVLWSL
jgi:hypothetical protein